VLLSCLHLVLLHGDGLMEVHGMDGRLCVWVVCWRTRVWEEIRSAEIDS
jgi:hypothetical protein